MMTNFLLLSSLFFLHSFGMFFFSYDKKKEKEEALGFLLPLRYVCFFEVIYEEDRFRFIY